MTALHRFPSRALCSAAALAFAAFGAQACSRSPRAARAPHADFIVSAGDSTFWARSDDSGLKMRGSPLVLARLDDKFLELYVVDDDRSFENALFVGQRLFQRDLVSGDSSEIFRDTLAMMLSERYERRHPDARRLAPDEDPGDEPATTATAEVSVLGVHGPFLSVEYHADTGATDDDGWHMTRHMVIDLRTGKQVTVADVLGAADAAGVLARGRKLFAETIDSIRRDRRPAAQRALKSIGHFRFDPRSFALTAPNGSLMIAFSAPGQGMGGEGFVLPIRPIAVTEPPWWADVKAQLPTATREHEELWNRGAYTVRAVYDTAPRPVQIAIVDSAGHDFWLGGVSAPVHRIYWLDRPPITSAQRAALVKAFDEAALYDEAAKRASLSPDPQPPRSTFALAPR